MAQQKATASKPSSPNGVECEASSSKEVESEASSPSKVECEPSSPNEVECEASSSNEVECEASSSNEVECEASSPNEVECEASSPNEVECEVRTFYSIDDVSEEVDSHFAKALSMAAAKQDPPRCKNLTSPTLPTSDATEGTYSWVHVAHCNYMYTEILAAIANTSI